MRVRPGTDADAVAAAAVVRQVLQEHGLPFEPRTLDADHGLIYQLELVPGRVPARPAGRPRRVLVPRAA
jgi:hypothetical protein